MIWVLHAYDTVCLVCVCVCVCVRACVCVCVLHTLTKVLLCSGPMEVDPQLATAVIADTRVLLVVQPIKSTTYSGIDLRISHLSNVLGLTHQVTNLARDERSMVVGRERWRAPAKEQACRQGVGFNCTLMGSWQH